LADLAIERPSHVAHQFDDMEQQVKTSTLGMWVFLLTEIMFFGGLFGAYTVYRSMYPEAFATTSMYMAPFWGAVNTIVLICSSLTMALAVQSAQIGSKRALIWFLIFTMIFGVMFLGVKAIEYTEHWNDHKVPGFGFEYEQSSPHDSNLFHHAQIFFCFYFFMTGFHALHMVVGLGLMTVLLVMAMRGRFSPGYYTPIEIGGLYWHFVDIVWIYLFALLYLIGRTHA